MIPNFFFSLVLRFVSFDTKIPKIPDATSREKVVNNV